MSRSELTNPQDRLPEPLRAAGGKRPVLVFLHGPECEACRAYAARLDPGRFATEGGALRIIEDDDRRLARDTRVEPPAVVVADEWGEIHSRSPAGEAHDFPAPEALLEWLEYLAVRCPECEGEAY
ncbi:MAG: hypothetical protein ACRD2J_01960 [Thermoanaerobaculia bacterium]